MRIKLFLLVVIFLFVFISCNSVKYAEDYSPVDYVKSKNILLGVREPSKQELRKYDMNNDKIISYFDISIIRQMLDGYYDAYETRNGQHKAIKYKKE